MNGKLFLGALAICITLALNPAAAHSHDHQQSHGAHLHGVAELYLVLDGDELSLELISPAANVVGFEHQPRNEEQRQAISQALESLRAGEKLLQLPAAARCRLVQAEAELSHGDDHGHKHDHDHADFSAQWQFQCEDPDRLNYLEVRIFDYFPGTERIKLQAVTPKGQLGAELTPSTTRLDL